LVINNSEDSAERIKEDNQRTINLICSLQNDLKVKNKLSIAYVDASTEGLELDAKHAGVGLARKIGMDLSLGLFDYSNDRKKLLICCDADCDVSYNYLTTIVDYFNEESAHAGYVAYEHPVIGNSPETYAIICYELFLHYYVLSLKYSKSPFANHTIGSTIICDYEAYINVQGMNKRKAAEDFYFIEKLSKKYKIHPIKNATVYPSNRVSLRVPFGTGQRIKRFLTNDDEYRLYSPNSFTVLKKWNKVLYDIDKNEVEYLLDESNRIDPVLCEFLIHNNFEQDFFKISNNSSSIKQLQIQKKIWFDAFKTLKLIHWLRDHKYPDENMFDAIDKMFTYLNISLPARRTFDTLPTLDQQKSYLNIIREHTYHPS
jgi:hypothetical protein